MSGMIFPKSKFPALSSFSNPNPSTVASNHCPHLPRPVAPVPTSAPPYRDYPTFDRESREIHGCSDVGWEMEAWSAYDVLISVVLTRVLNHCHQLRRPSLSFYPINLWSGSTPWICLCINTATSYILNPFNRYILCFVFTTPVLLHPLILNPPDTTFSIVQISLVFVFFS